MSRPRKDGSAASPARKRVLTELFVKRVKAGAAAFNVWDAKERGLVIRVQPTGLRSFKAVYSFRGRPRWYHIGQVPLGDARRIAARIRLAVAEGKDPVGERQAERGAGTFGELADRYLAEHAKRRNKSWRQGRNLIERYVLPRWGKLDAKSITRADAKALAGKIAAPVLANQVLAATSAVFSWGAKQEVVTNNPCRGVDRNDTQSRERVLSDREVPLFWEAFDSAGLIKSAALKTILLTGQRPGEVAHMRHEHIIDGLWWEMAGKADPKIGWPGTKNGTSHRVWLAPPVRAVLAELSDGEDTDAGFVFAGSRGKPVAGLPAAMRAICTAVGANEKVTPHDLRRTFSTKVTGLGFGREALNRVTNHREGGIASVYDRHHYAEENRRIMEAVAAKIMALVEGSEGENVVVGAFR